MGSLAPLKILHLAFTEEVLQRHEYRQFTHFLAYFTSIQTITCGRHTLAVPYLQPSCVHYYLCLDFLKDGWWAIGIVVLAELCIVLRGRGRYACFSATCLRARTQAINTVEGFFIFRQLHESRSQQQQTRVICYAIYPSGTLRASSEHGPCPVSSA